MRKIDCLECKEKNSCCDFGVWVDLEEAKKILSLGLKGDFYHLEKDKCFPSGYKVGTSYEDNHCSFLTPKGLCSIHKVDYILKPAHCKEFPYENGKLSLFADVLCPLVKSTLRLRPSINSGLTLSERNESKGRSGLMASAVEPSKRKPKKKTR